MTNLRRGKLIARTLLDLGRTDAQQSQIVERAEAFLGLEQQENAVTAHGLGQQRLHVPGIGDRHKIRLKLIDRTAISPLNLRDIPRRPIKFQRLARNQPIRGHAADPPGRKAGEALPHLVPGPNQKPNQPGRMHIAAAGRGPVEEEAEDGDANLVSGPVKVVITLRVMVSLFVH